MKARINTTVINTAKPQDKRYKIRDTRTIGLILRVEPNGQKYWEVDFRVNGRRTTKVLGNARLKNLTVAREEAETVLKKAEKGIDVHQTKEQDNLRTLEGFITKYYAKYAEENIRGHVKHLASLKRNFGHLYNKRLDEIGELHIEAWRRERTQQDKVTFETIKRDYTVLRACLNTAIQAKTIRSHQLQNYRFKRKKNDPQPNPQKVRYLSEDEEKRLRIALKGFDGPIEGFTLLALNTGLRFGDLVELEWEHVNLELGHIRKIIAKISHTEFGKMAKTIPLSNEVKAVLRHREHEDKYVFARKEMSEIIHNFKRVWTAVCKKAELENFRFHDCRHDFASKLVMAGVPLIVVRDLLTHQSLETTQIYAHLAPSHLDNAIAEVFNK